LVVLHGHLLGLNDHAQRGGRLVGEVEGRHGGEQKRRA
jgi:hypothetical protein